MSKENDYLGDPVVLPARKPESISFYPTGWNDCLDEIAKLGPLYTHADPAEVERLRRLLNEAAEELKNTWEGSWGGIPQDSVYHVIVGEKQ